MSENLNAGAILAKRLKKFTDKDEKEWIKLSDDGNQIKIIETH